MTFLEYELWFLHGFDLLVVFHITYQKVKTLESYEKLSGW